MGMDAEDQTANRPYAPPSNVTAVLKRVRSRNLPERVDIEYLRDSGVPDGSLGRAMFALNFLELVAHDVPTPALRSIATSTDEEYKATLAGLIRKAYREVFDAIDPAEDSQDRIVNFFRRYTPASQRDRMVVFFLGMCREAGIPTLDVPRQRASGVSTGGKATRQTGHGTTRQSASTARSGQWRSKTDDGNTRLSGIPPALELLVRSLPPEGTLMPEYKRRQWLEMARATLTYMYPEQEERGDIAEEADE